MKVTVWLLLMVLYDNCTEVVYGEPLRWIEFEGGERNDKKSDEEFEGHMNYD